MKKSVLDYVKSKLDNSLVEDTYILTIHRKATQKRTSVLQEALEIHLNDTKEQLRRVEA
jgi:hypothetical protein